MIKHNGMYFITAPRFEPNSCKGCYWYPTRDVIYRETHEVYDKPGSIPTYLLNGCVAMHKNNNGNVCRNLNLIFIKKTK